MRKNGTFLACSIIAIATLFAAPTPAAELASMSEQEFRDLWVVVSPKDGPSTRAIPTGSDLIYTFMPSTGTKNFRVQFYDDAACTGGVDAYFSLPNASFTSGETWYLSGDALRLYVNERFIDSGSAGFMRLLGRGLVLRDQTAGLQGSCTELVPLGSSGDTVSPFQSTGTPGVLNEGA